MRLREIAEEPRHNDWTSPKNLAKYILVVILTFVGYYGVSGSVMGFQALELKNQVKEFSHQLKTGGGASSEAALAARINKSIVDLNSTLTNPFWSPLTNHFLADAQSEINLAAQLVRVAPNLLGAQSPKRYLLVFQNPAEARGTGGIIGAYAEIQVYRGAITVLRQGSNVGLKSLNEIPMAMPAEYGNLYGSDPAIWQNSNMSPHFPYAAGIWSALWADQFSEQLDGVVATDPIALSYVLKAIGPVTLPSGEIIDTSNVVSKTLSTAYQRFSNDNIARKDYLVAVMKAVMQKIIAGNFSRVNFLRVLQTPLLEHRILLSLANPVDQAIIAPTIVSGVLSDAPNNEFRSVIQNTSGNKLDYYLSRSTKIESLSCKLTAVTRVTETITNTLKSAKGLPDYVVGRLDLGLAHGAGGRDGFTVMIYGPTGAEAQSVLRSDGTQASPQLASERGHPIAIFPSDLAPGASETFNVVFSGGSGRITYEKQPLVLPEKVAIISSCG